MVNLQNNGELLLGFTTEGKRRMIEMSKGLSGGNKKRAGKAISGNALAQVMDKISSKEASATVPADTTMLRARILKDFG